MKLFLQDYAGSKRTTQIQRGYAELKRRAWSQRAQHGSKEDKAESQRKDYTKSQNDQCKFKEDNVEPE